MNMKNNEVEKLSAIQFFVDDIRDEMVNVIKDQPTKMVMIAYMRSWIDQLNTIKGII